MRMIKVWDRFVRFFHWSLVLLIVTAYVSAERSETLHVWAGHAVLILIVMRVVWGFIGAPHARFCSFVTSPLAALAYLKALPARRAPRTLGHNPAGGWMVLALLAVIALTTLTGLANYAAEGKGVLAAVMAPTAVSVTDSRAGSTPEHDHLPGAHETDHDEHDDDDDDDAVWHELHELMVNLMLMLVAVHIAGVLASSWGHRENLVRAMVTGTKRER